MRYREVCGFPTIVHGGFTATVMDETLGFLFFALKKQKALPFWGPAYTAHLEVEYKAVSLAFSAYIAHSIILHALETSLFTIIRKRHCATCDTNRMYTGRCVSGSYLLVYDTGLFHVHCILCKRYCNGCYAWTDLVIHPILDTASWLQVLLCMMLLHMSSTFQCLPQV